MTANVNCLNQPIGFPVADWTPRPRPPRNAMEGKFCRIEALDPDLHAAALHEANLTDTEARIWTYMAYGPFKDLSSYRDWVTAYSRSEDPLFHAVIDKRTGKAAGVASYLRIDPANGAIEVGHINYAPPLQRTAAASEAMFLMMARVFDELGYRRYEWKCDALNAPSRKAAERLGFRYEGLFRQAATYKGRNRDTAWYAMTDKDWPAVKAAFQAWLAADNFDRNGRQKTRLASFSSRQ